MSESLRWPDDYPDPEALRREIRVMIAAVVGALCEVFGDQHVRAIWFKGSAQKRWESPIDYVPALSDVDLHVWLSETAARGFYQLDPALDVQASTQTRYAEAMPAPLHVPRPQINLVNALLQQEDFIASPAAIVETVYGTPYEGGDYSDAEKVRAQDRASLVDDADEVANVPHRAIDRPGFYLWDLLRALSWRVSPIGSRVLCVSGLDPQQAWSMNRTRLLGALRERGFDDIANAWEQFYLSGWRYFLSGHEDGPAGRDAVRAASESLRLAGAFAAG